MQLIFLVFNAQFFNDVYVQSTLGVLSVITRKAIVP